MSDRLPTKVLQEEAAAEAALTEDAKANAGTVSDAIDAGEEQIMVRGASPEPEHRKPILATADGFRLGTPAPQAPVDARSTGSESGQNGGSEQSHGEVSDADKTQEELAREIKLERERNASILGRINSVIKPLDEESKRLRKRVEELEQELASKRDAERPDVEKLRKSIPGEIPIDDNELEMIMRISKQAAREELMRSIPEATKSLKDEIGATERSNQMRRFIDQVEAKFPGFVKLDANNDKRWTAFLNTAIPGTGGRIKYASVAEDAVNAMDLKGLVEIVDEFCKQSGFAFGSRADDDRVSAQVRGRQSGAGRQTTVNEKPYFTRAQVERFTKDLNTKAIYEKLAPDAVEELRRDIEEAEEEGRVIDG